MKTCSIIKPNCRELANHLWNYVSIYAYGLETGVCVRNPSFIRWHRYFRLEKGESPLTRVVARLPFLHGLWLRLCALYGSYLVRVRASCVRLTLGITLYLPPTRSLVAGDACETAYFIGWHFRNPVGLEKYRDTLTTAFTPKQGVLRNIEDTLAPLKGKKLIGVHLRQEPYRGFEDQHLLVLPLRIRHIIDEYLHEENLNSANVALVIVSDKRVDPVAFSGFTTRVRYGNDVTSLFLLSRCSVVIGSNSTSSNLSAWFGNVPHIVAMNESIDWDYYHDRTTYFESKYATLAL